MINGDPVLMAILAAQQKLQSQEQYKAQVLQSLGFGKNMNQFGAIPQGHGILNVEGTAYTRPGGVPSNIGALLKMLLGVESQSYARFGGFTRDFPEREVQTQATRPIENLQLNEAKAAHQNVSSLDDIQQLYYLYPREMEYLLGGGR